jgi:hypothetical protein
LLYIVAKSLFSGSTGSISSLIFANLFKDPKLNCLLDPAVYGSIFGDPFGQTPVVWQNEVETDSV